MEYREVRSQAELEAALAADGVVPVCVGGGHFYVPSSYGSATVQAYDSATVRAYDSATVQAYDSATVRAYDSATVQASGSATVQAYDSATVEAYDSATVRAYDSATVQASGSATVRAYDSATVQAYDSATVEAATHVAVHQHSTRASIHGGHIIRIPDWESASPAEWADYTGTTTQDGHLTVYKAVSPDLTSRHGTPYPIGGTVTAPDWRPDRVCGGGLHFSHTPRHARAYHGQHRDGVRFLACRIPLAETVVLGHDKVKSASCEVLHEVDIDGQPIAIPEKTAP